MVQLGDIIEIESSPEHTPFSATHNLKSREKGKGKATPYRLASSVIELTDSESEADEGKVSTSPIRRVGPSHSNSHAGSSSKRSYIPNLKSYPVGPTGSSGNIFMPPQQNGVLASGSSSGTEAATKQKLNGHNENPPLFLPGDEEHGSPTPDTAAHIGRVEASAGTWVIEQEHTVLNPDTQSQIPNQPTASGSDSDPISIEKLDPTSIAVAQILEIIPDVEPTHLLQLIETHLPTYSVFRDPGADDGEGETAAGKREATVEEQAQGVMGHVLHLLIENADYPKADSRAGKGKGKRVGESDDEINLQGKGKAKDSSKKPKIDYASIDRPFLGGPKYFDLALVCPYPLLTNSLMTLYLP